MREWSTRPEECDDGIDPEAEAYIGEDQPCTPDCTLARCGDGYTLGPHDGEPGEECDFGDELNTGEYGGCTKECELAPHCGDDVLAPGIEACDCGGEAVVDGRCVDTKDLATGVQCSAATCQFAAKLVFIAEPEAPSLGWSGRLSFGDVTGVEAADWICDDLAVKAGLVPSAENALLESPRFRAWISTHDSQVKDRFNKQDELWYVQRSGAVVAKGWTALTEDGPESDITSTQHYGKHLQGAYLWSNTNSDGTSLSDTLDCGKWTQDDVLTTGNLGSNSPNPDNPDNLSYWTDNWKYSPFSCFFEQSFYCFEQ